MLSGSNTFEDVYTNKGALHITKSKIIFYRKNIFKSCRAKLEGGAIYSIGSELQFYGNTYLFNNTGYMGGGIFVQEGVITFNKYTEFVSNIAESYGGGIFSLNSQVNLSNTAVFSSNRATRGGGLYSTLDSTLVLAWFMLLNTSHNIATEYGGAIYHEDSVTIVQCSNISNLINEVKNRASAIPKSFLEIGRVTDNPLICPHILSSSDEAGIDGSFLYGGLLDRSIFSDYKITPYQNFTTTCPMVLLNNDKEKNIISSEPFQLAPCKNSQICL